MCSLQCMVVTVEFSGGSEFAGLSYDFLLVITEDSAPRHHLGTLCRAISWLPVLAPEILASHGSIPMVLNCVFRATGDELGYVSPPVAEFIVGNDKSFLFFSAPTVSLQLIQKIN